MIALVCFITVINYLDRTALGIAAPTIMETTGITKEQYSWIVSAFQLAYTLGQPGNDSNLLIVFYVQIMPDDFVMQLHRF